MVFGRYKSRRMILPVLFLAIGVLLALGRSAVADDTPSCKQTRATAGGKTSETQTETSNESNPVPTFACGEQQCEIASQYCHKAFPGVAIPGEPASVDRCLALPPPNCEEVARSGRCIGNIETGLTVEVYFP